MPIKISLISLGCARNLVDSEIILGTLKDAGAGFKIVDSPSSADIAIVNTCSFIEDAKKESIGVILDLIGLKKSGKIKGILVAGCLPQRYGKVLQKELGEIDGFIGVEGFARLPKLINDIADGKRIYSVSRNPAYLYDWKTPRQILTPRHFAYVKISEGCSHKCSFCVIPKIRGRHRSRKIESIVEEARYLISKGVKEINLVGQDTTLYGADIYGRAALPKLLKRLTALEGTRWLRLMYAHPAHLNDELISVISAEERICKYIDLPIQHISDRILKAMRRGTSRRSIDGLLTELRRRIPGIAIRTAVIVGFPGETEGEFEELLDFVKETRFGRLGAFVYSEEEGTPAAKAKKQIPEKEKLARWNEIMKVQQRISSENNGRFIGSEFEILVDEKEGSEKGVYLGRTYMDAPEIDGLVYIKGPGIRAGDFVTARITDTLEYDLVGIKA
ncbi:MAG: ribosomal protein S12 methylthiotransferase RimO [Omnitrophica WOR_2 bacterium RIFCSPLOWO2_12_FULL_51_24]|nr:MAG: ribosomal protein S12 methylthiotransferase RimO [Omnitrophica WOR_2 bacterium RIFCSPHIGHO2_01_FULL_49_10]OGX34624.1 MAG: ribosomal protein S12 methylthiotransferase RimO [Omnitrophica WOR_2 bacterium RIFCSPLOWO2_02_FULL_50_19]OGX41956.1 MAG: ribosomal protein S12 methylthiotransferase RimO [Omnitrophica WOR_2 bacterium RIFCSPLOWO2_12_FULL_51_24]